MEGGWEPKNGLALLGTCCHKLNDVACDKLVGGEARCFDDLEDYRAYPGDAFGVSDQSLEKRTIIPIGKPVNLELERLQVLSCCSCIRSKRFQTIGKDCSAIKW